MISRQEVSKKLLEAAGQIKDLSSENESLKAEKEELMQKVASLEEQLNSLNSGDEYSDPALQKQAGEEFVGRGSFGSADGEIPVFGSDLTPEQRLDMILNGESPSDYN